jgi:Flp pilus assembly protein TadG
MLKRIKALLSDSRGGVAILFSLSMLPVIGLTGAAIDYSSATSKRAALQAAADAAALAGIAAPAGQKVATAQSIFNANMASISGVTASASISEPDSQRVVVTATGNVPLMLYSALMPGGMQVAVTSTARSTSTTSNAATCIFVMRPTLSGSVNNTSTINAPDCEMHVHSTSNGALTNNNSTMTMSRHCVAGTASILGGTTTNLVNNCAVDVDPFAGTLPTVALGACTFNSQTFNANATVNLTPGTYCGTTTFNAVTTVNFAPGLYVLNGQMVFNSVTNLRGTGVTFYFAASPARWTMNSVTNSDLLAPTSGTYKDILMYQDPAMPTQQVTVNSGGVRKFTGLIWLPTQDLAINSGSSVNDLDTIAVVVRRLLLNSSTWRVVPHAVAPRRSIVGAAYLER